MSEPVPPELSCVIYSTLGLRPGTRLRMLFRSSLKMPELRKCENDIQFPDPAETQYRPLQKD